MGEIYIPDKVKWHPSVWWSRFRVRWPFIIWLLAVLAAAFLYTHGGRFSGMAGIVDAAREQISPLETARLLSLHVEVGQTVRAGDVIAEMDTSLLDSEMAVESLQSERRFAEATSRIGSDLRDARIRQAEAAGELEVLEQEIDRLDELLEKRLIDAQTVARLRARKEALARAVTLYPGMIDDLEAELARMRARQETMDGWLGDKGQAADGSTPGDVATGRLGWLYQRREAYILRARSEGMVAEVLHQPGEVVPAGEPIATVTLNRASQVMGFLPEANAGDVVVGMTAYVTRTTRRGRPIRASVVSMVPEILPLPNRVSPFRGQAFRGRRVILVPAEPHDFLPGEAVTIQFQEPLLSLLIHFLRGDRAPGTDQGA